MAGRRVLVEELDAQQVGTYFLSRLVAVAQPG